jgi:hypothetical protein
VEARVSIVIRRINVRAAVYELLDDVSMAAARRAPKRTRKHGDTKPSAVTLDDPLRGFGVALPRSRLELLSRDVRRLCSELPRGEVRNVRPRDADLP